jgi:hypothetical protein
MGNKGTVNDLEKAFGMLPGFFKNNPKDILSQMYPLFKKYRMAESIIPNQRNIEK